MSDTQRCYICDRPCATVVCSGACASEAEVWSKRGEELAKVPLSPESEAALLAGIESGRRYGARPMTPDEYGEEGPLDVDHPEAGKAP